MCVNVSYIKFSFYSYLYYRWNYANFNSQIYLRFKTELIVWLLNCCSMSQNRGYRRDRQSYQMNTSSNFGNRNSLLNVNPWEGGLVPGNSRSGLAGLLPTPPQQSSLVSQLSSTEAQLAIASNLLTSLLRPQQNTQPQVSYFLECCFEIIEYVSLINFICRYHHYWA